VSASVRLPLRLLQEMEVIMIGMNAVWSHPKNGLLKSCHAALVDQQHTLYCVNYASLYLEVLFISV